MSVMVLSFRPMTINDLEQVMLQENSAYEFPWTAQIFKDCIRVGYECWMAFVEEELVAHAVISIAAGESHMLNLAVSKNHQGKGIGKQFIQFLLDIAKRQDAAVMMLEVRPSNTQAINCYNSSGFNEIGCRKDYYPAPNGKEDALLFARQVT